MRIGLSSLDPVVTEKVLHRVQAVRDKLNNKQPLTPEEQAAYDVLKSRIEDLNMRGGCLFFSSLLLTPAVYGLTANSIGPTSAVFAAVTALTGGLAWAFDFDLARRMRRAVSQQEVEAALRLLDLSETERLYCEIVHLLMNMDERLDDGHAKEVLQQLNALMERNRQYQNAEASLNNDSSSASTEVQESAAVQRLRAQQEVIRDGLLSVKAALAQTIAMPDPSLAQSVEDVTSTIAQIQAQARARDEAVQEVQASLRVE